MDKNGRCAFNALQHKQSRGHIQLYAFDILGHRGRNVLRLPIEELLTEALHKVQYPVIQSVPFDVKPAELLCAKEALQFEGVIAKRKRSIYEPGQRNGACGYLPCGEPIAQNLTRTNAPDTRIKDSRSTSKLLMIIERIYLLCLYFARRKKRINTNPFTSDRSNPSFHRQKPAPSAMLVW